jgi:hypothetical protein
MSGGGIVVVVAFDVAPALAAVLGVAPLPEALSDEDPRELSPQPIPAASSRTSTATAIASPRGRAGGRTVRSSTGVGWRQLAIAECRIQDLARGIAVVVGRPGVRGRHAKMV